MAEFIYKKCQAIDAHSHPFAEECCYHCPAGSRQLQHDPLLQLAEMESDHTAHEEERSTLTTRALQWFEQEPIDKDDGLANYNYIYPVTMVSMGYHCGLSVIYPQFELAVRHLGINHYCSLSLMSKYFSCLPISHG